MKRGTTILTASVLVSAVALPGWAQVRELPTQTTTIAGTIETINQAERVMNIRIADGSIVAVNVPQSVQRFSELKVGDRVNATYNNNVMVRLKPPGEAAVDTAETGGAQGTTGNTQAMTRRMTANIVEIDRTASSISFEGPNGWKYSRRVADPTVLAQVNVGDRVDIIWNTDLMVSVQ